MSYRTTIEILCDVKDCNVKTVAVVGSSNRLEAETAARARGWLQIWNKGKKAHICVSCNPDDPIELKGTK